MPRKVAGTPELDQRGRHLGGRRQQACLDPAQTGGQLPDRGRQQRQQQPEQHRMQKPTRAPPCGGRIAAGAATLTAASAALTGRRRSPRRSSAAAGASTVAVTSTSGLMIPRFLQCLPAARMVCALAASPGCGSTNCGALQLLRRHGLRQLGGLGQQAGELARIGQRPLAAALVDRQHLLDHLVRMLGGERLAHVQHAVAVGVRIAEEQWIALRQLDIGHHRVEARPRRRRRPAPAPAGPGRAAAAPG